jgi:hypothetical protein
MCWWFASYDTPGAGLVALRGKRPGTFLSGESVQETTAHFYISYPNFLIMIMKDTQMRVNSGNRLIRCSISVNSGAARHGNLFC